MQIEYRLFNGADEKIGNFSSPLSLFDEDNEVIDDPTAARDLLLKAVHRDIETMTQFGMMRHTCYVEVFAFVSDLLDTVPLDLDTLVLTATKRRTDSSLRCSWAIADPHSSKTPSIFNAKSPHPATKPLA